MFTGIVQSVGTVASIDGGVLRLACPAAWTEGDSLAIGESVAVNGCCLTVVSDEPRFDLSQETLSRTSLGDLKPGSRVNLERALRPSDRFGGHIVQGHVDGTGVVRSISHEQTATVVTLAAPKGSEPYLIDKGSIAIDGVSLTVVRPRGIEFEVWVVPHTLRETQIGSWEPFDRVNLEFDVIAKYVERLVALGRT